MGNQQRGPGCIRRIIGCIGSLVMMAVIVIVIYFAVTTHGDVNNLPPQFLDLFDTTKPGSDGLTPDQVDKWPHDGNGLSMMVINALDTDWYPYFNKAISQWDSGYPDTLTLSTELASAPDSKCQADMGLVMACNGNYGETGWKGIAEILSSSGVIQSVTVRMNDYYMASRNADEMQYTVCHELGHAWGLHHTDENFNNRDLANCLDYTNRPQNNMQPDAMNYDFLYGMYGLVPGAAPYSASPTPAPAPTASGGTSSQNSAPAPTASGTSSSQSYPTAQQQGSSPAPAPTATTTGGKNGKNGRNGGRDRALEGDGRAHHPEWLMDAIREVRQDNALAGRVELPGGYVLEIQHIPA